MTLPFAQTVNRALRRVPTWLLYPLLVIPGVVLFWQALQGQLGADPLKALERQYGVWALQLLIATLLVTPIRNWTGIMLIRFRRAVGIMAFVYALAHLSVWLVLDMQFFWGQIWADLIKRPYITIGMTGFLMLVPLVVTSNNLSVRRLGAGAWQRLHRLAYPAILLGAVHFTLMTKVWETRPLVYLAIVAALVLVRVPVLIRRRRAAA